MKEYKRLTVRHPNSDYIAITETKQLQETRESKIVLNRLAELEDKIENGTLIELPCKVGDTVYRVMVDKRIKQPYEYKVIGFWYSVDDKCNDLHLGRYIDGVFVSSISVPFSEFGRMLFLTKAEAEKAFAELEEQK